MKRNNIADAADDFKMFLRLSDASIDKHQINDVNNRLGDCCYLDSKYADAIKFYDRVIEAADPDADYFLDPHASIQIHSCLSSTRHNGSEPSLNASQRSTTLNNLIAYYHVHLSDFKNFKSHEVLHAVLR